MSRYSILICTLSLGSIACSLQGCHNSDNASDTDAQAMPVEVASPVVDSITLAKTYPGFLNAKQKVNVSCLVNGRLLTRNYTEGDRVRKGQVLFTIESTKYSDAVQQARAALETAQSTHEYATRQYAAMQKAYQADAVSQMDLIQAKSNVETAQASIESAKASLQSALTDLSRCTITAPIDGYVSASTIDPGNYISGAGSPFTLCTIYDDARLDAIFSVEDSQYEEMLGGTDSESDPQDRKIKIPLQFSNNLPHQYVATLRYVDVTVDPNTGTLTLKATVENPYGELRNGMYVNAVLPYGNDPHAVLVRDASISTDQAGKFLYVVNDSNKVVYTPIVVGELYHDSLRVVKSGISPDQRYVSKAMLKVRDGQTVKPFEAK